MVYHGRMRSCHFCGAEVDGSRPVGRSSTCDDCGKDLRICLNCAFYAPGSHWDCRETIDEAVREKDRGNFCAAFSFANSAARSEERERSAAGGRHTAPGAEKAKKDFETLFGKDS